MNEAMPNPRIQHEARPRILGPTGQPARLAPEAKCPRCGAGPDQRVPSGGFGEPHQVCRACAFEFEKE